jgi:hypothetical protein
MVKAKRRRVFFSFHCQRDALRASQVRNIGVVDGNSSVSDNKWEEVRRGGDLAIHQWIDRQLLGRECSVVPVSAEAVRRRWVKYEIKVSWNAGKGVSGIRIHRLLNQEARQAAARQCLFRQFCFRNGKSLSRLVSARPSFIKSSNVCEYTADRLNHWIERAVQSRNP